MYTSGERETSILKYGFSPLTINTCRGGRVGNVITCAESKSITRYDCGVGNA
jgi:hypothetical protein